MALDAQQDQAVVCGFDQSRAIGLFLGAVVLASLLAMPLLWGYFGFVAGSAIGGALLALVLALGQLFRFRVTVSRTGVVLERRWAGICYARRQLELASATFEVWGTGDWGLDGGWPMERACEIKPDKSSVEGEMIGTSHAALTTAQFLMTQRGRFLG